MKASGLCNDTVRGILCVLGGVLIHLTYGYFYTVGNMAPYIVDYMNFQNMPVEQTSAVWLTSVGFSMQALAMPIAAYIATKIGFRIVIFCSCVLHSGSIALTYFAIGWGFWAVVLIYGILTGIAFGAGYSVIIATTSAWFPHRRGLIVGVVLGGFGAGSLVFTPIQTGFINPTNAKVDNVTGTFTDPVILNRVPQAFLLLAGITAGLQLVGWLLMREKPKPAIQYPVNQMFVDEEEKDEKRSRHEDDMMNHSEKYFVNMDRNENVDVQPLVVLKASDFYLLWFAVCCGAIPITLVSALYKVAGRVYITDDLFLAGVSMAASVCNSLGRVIWGLVCDRLSFKLPMCCMCLVWTALLFSFPFISEISGSATKVVFVLWVSLLFLCQCGIFVFAPSAAATIFGSANLAVNYGFVYTAFLVGSLTASIMVNLTPKAVGIQMHFMVGGAMSIAAFLFILLVIDRKVPYWFQILNAPVRLRLDYLQR